MVDYAASCTDAVGGIGDRAEHMGMPEEIDEHVRLQQGKLPEKHIGTVRGDRRRKTAYLRLPPLLGACGLEELLILAKVALEMGPRAVGLGVEECVLKVWGPGCVGHDSLYQGSLETLVGTVFCKQAVLTGIGWRTA